MAPGVGRGPGCPDLFPVRVCRGGRGGGENGSYAYVLRVHAPSQTNRDVIFFLL